MGDIKKLRKKYVKPGHPWQKDRIRSEILLVGRYGLRNKREVWIARTLLGDFRRRAREVLSLSSSEKEKEAKALMRRLQRYGLTKENATIDNVLDLTLPDILERRLQTIVYKLGLAKSVHQARQLVVHGHIAIKGSATRSPGRLVRIEEEPQVSYAPNSPFMNKDLVKEEIEEHLKEQKKTTK
jgi:small subunit ribosomal protein S4